MRHRVTRLAVLGLATFAIAAQLASPATAATGVVRGEGSPDQVPGSYLVGLEGDSDPARLAARYGGEVGFVYRTAAKGFSVALTPAAARRLAADPAVSYVEQDRIIRTQGVQSNPPSWGLDRVDQANLPLNQSFTYPNTASNVTAYVIDTGIFYEHVDFGGRASLGVDVTGGDGRDCSAHGTHVAGTIGGASYGIAKGVQLKSVRVSKCDGIITTARLAAGIDWITANAVLPAVANMSFSTYIVNEPSQTVDNAVRALVQHGVTVTVAAGNTSDNACQYSPQRVTEAITVAASGSTDARPSWSSYGTCVDMFAPGENITSASSLFAWGGQLKSGTSMASAHVAGAAAVYLSSHTSSTAAQVQQALIDAATPNKISNPGAGTPNRLLRVVG